MSDWFLEKRKTSPLFTKSETKKPLTRFVTTSFIQPSINFKKRNIKLISLGSIDNFSLVNRRLHFSKDNRNFIHERDNHGIVEKVVVFGVIPTALKPRLKARLSSAFSAQVFGVWTHGQPPSYLFTIVSSLWTDREIWGVIIARYTPTEGGGVETPSMSLIFFPFLSTPPSLSSLKL